MNDEKNLLLDMQIEAVQTSIYCHIVKNIIARHRSISLIKVSVFSFVIKKRQHLRLKLIRRPQNLCKHQRHRNRKYTIIDIIC